MGAPWDGDVHILLAGWGKMGSALLDGWLDRGVPPGKITVVEPNAEARAELAKRHGVDALPSPGGLDPGFHPGVVVFAVKPQAMDAVAPAYAHFSASRAVFLSIAAGKTLDYFKGYLGSNAAIVRSMPNMPAAVRRGITVACPNGLVTQTQRGLCQGLLEAVGDVAWIEDEALMDPVTALSGSGPAYVFFLAECMAQGGVKAGLPEDLAARLAQVTVSGAGELLRLAEQAPSRLRKNVTSPGGTTAAALAVLMGDPGLESLMTEAIIAATRRSRELAKWPRESNE